MPWKEIVCSWVKLRGGGGSGEISCLSWCAGNGLSPARKWSGEHRPAYISPPAFKFKKKKKKLARRYNSSNTRPRRPRLTLLQCLFYFLKDKCFATRPWLLDFHTTTLGGLSVPCLKGTRDTSVVPRGFYSFIGKDFSSHQVTEHINWSYLYQ